MMTDAALPVERRPQRDLGAFLFSFALVTDTHFTEVDGESSSPWPSNKLANERAELTFSKLNVMSPAFVLHLGDMVHPVPAQKSFRTAAERYKAAAAKLNCPVYLTPGNHDIGDKVVGWAPAGVIKPDYISQYAEIFGPHFYAFTSNGCRFIVLNASLLNSGLEEENEQRLWLEAELSANVAIRKFVAIHYPPYVYSLNEPGSYDNIDEPARSWLLNLVNQYQPEAIFSGHVHNFWYDVVGKTRFYILPATSFVRQDYSEMYRIEAGAENGRDDTAKLGFAAVDVYERGHVLNAFRCDDLKYSSNDARLATYANRLHPATNPLSPLGLDLRHPWADVIEIPANGGVDEFARKMARNDYPVWAIWEMGIRNLRVPLQDLTRSETRRRMELMRQSGTDFSVFFFGIPSDREIDNFRPEFVDSIEVVSEWPLNDKARTQLSELKRRTGVKLMLSKLRTGHHEIGPGRYAHSIQHGFVADELESLPQEIPRDTADGVVLRVARSSPAPDAIMQAAEWCRKTALKARLIIRLAADNPAAREDDDLANAVRVAESAFAALFTPEVAVIFDTFDDVDRGYFAANGLVDRRYNPRRAGIALKNLQATLLPVWAALRGARLDSRQEGKILLARGPKATVALLSPGADLDRLQEKALLVSVGTRFIDLSDGMKTGPIAKPGSPVLALTVPAA